MKYPQLKIIAVLCATTLWFYVVSGNTHQFTTQIPIQLINLPPKLALSAGIPDSIGVILEGSGFNLIRHRSHPGVITVDLSGALLGENQVILSQKYFNSAAGNSIQINRFTSNSALDIQLDTKIRKSVVVRNRSIIESAPGFVVVGTPVLSKEQVQISGARRNVTKIFELVSEEIKISNVTQDTVVFLALESPNQHFIELSQDSIQISVTVQPLATKTYSQIPVRLVGIFNHTQFTLKPKVAQISLSGGKDILDSILPSDLQPFIEFSRFIIEDKPQLKPVLHIQKPIQSFHVEPELFSLDTLSPITPSDTTP
jgi:YbbR domain-containing protein